MQLVVCLQEAFPDSARVSADMSAPDDIPDSICLSAFAAAATMHDGLAQSSTTVRAA